MRKRQALFYFFVFSIPVFMGLVAWQSNRYAKLDREIRRLEAAQENWLEGNRRLIASIAVLSSSARIGQVALHDLRLVEMPPENVLQVRIESSEVMGGP
jgi:cell division protein FtsL